MKCSNCNKKISPGMDFKCECDTSKKLCIACRLPEVHPCTKKVAKIELEKCVKDKLVKI
jgi:hypothetical protein